MFRFIFVGVLMLVFAETSSAESLSAQLERRYVGRSVDVALEAFGNPSKTDPMKGGYAMAWTLGDPSNVESFCMLALQTNADGTVLNYGFRGPAEACRGFIR